MTSSASHVNGTEHRVPVGANVGMRLQIARRARVPDRVACGAERCITRRPAGEVSLHDQDEAPRLLQPQTTPAASQELERELKFSCESFIMSVTKLVVEPALSFMSKAAAAGKVPAAPGAVAGAGKDGAAGAKPLHQLVSWRRRQVPKERGGGGAGGLRGRGFEHA